MLALFARVWVPVGFLVYALLYLLNIRHLPIAASLLPELMLGVLGLLLVWDIIDESVQWRRRDRLHWRDEAGQLWGSVRDRGYRPVGMMFLTGLWLFGMSILGFYVATTLFIVAGLLLLGERRIWLIGILTVVVVGMTYAVFTAALSLRLPTGMFL